MASLDDGRLSVAKVVVMSCLIDQVPPRLGESGDRQDRVLSVSGKKRCSHCKEELGKLPCMLLFTITITIVTITITMMFNLVKLIIAGRGAAMIIESLRLFYHIRCFKCCVCRFPHFHMSQTIHAFIIFDTSNIISSCLHPYTPISFLVFLLNHFPQECILSLYPSIPQLQLEIPSISPPQRDKSYHQPRAVKALQHFNRGSKNKRPIKRVYNAVF